MTMPATIERKAASSEAVDRRRLSRRARRESDDQKRNRREREAVIRLSARALRHGQVFSLLQLDYRYWEAKSCGWDVATKMFALDVRGLPTLPEDSTAWRWWLSLHWRQRATIRRASHFTPLRMESLKRVT